MRDTLPKGGTAEDGEKIQTETNGIPSTTATEVNAFLHDGNRGAYVDQKKTQNERD